MRFKIWIESHLQGRVDALKGFKSTPEAPYPSMLPGGKPVDDVLGVLAGVKPAAVVSYNELVSDPDWKEIESQLKAHGYIIKSRTPNDIAVGRPDAVATLVRLSDVSYFKASRGIIKDPQYHADFAHALGISNDALRHFYHRFGILAPTPG